jgi:hypothetical protein
VVLLAEQVERTRQPPVARLGMDVHALTVRRRQGAAGPSSNPGS